MPVEQQGDTRIWRRRDRKAAWQHFGVTLAVAALVVFCAKIISDQTTWEFVGSAPMQGADLAMRMWPPQLGYIAELWGPVVDTIHIATLGTILGVMIASPLAFLAANNTTPSKVFVRPVALALLVTSRSVNSIIWALMLVVIFGPGMLSGIIAIALRSVGFCGKLLYEAIEEIDAHTVEAVSSTGASRLQVLTFGVIPQIAPAFAGISVYRWDINIREATVLGLVGAGGIGMALQGAIDTLAWSRVSVIFLVILATVVLSEWVSAKARAAVI
ncbi:phosphonate ABC transporter, permease protein PhnE [Lujinxingia vulgaris]|uniref:Phosphonate ABC transporter, permease protein PhnE n=1 Tax=Lujinxingia vulgaris TaxID=2600176 RepID=A0A5C6WWF5_9DELT|nr:phosphonate ABC transporter, permease protein PhnE [Lujinxingia vulgaris]TXD33766.1 phosphonate ABC transporter, permease protein PhnE [Lujinxingia vulgaris]